VIVFKVLRCQKLKNTVKKVQIVGYINTRYKYVRCKQQCEINEKVVFPDTRRA